jgi:RNA polymerase sigma factor (sigma-70 family)
MSQSMEMKLSAPHGTIYQERIVNKPIETILNGCRINQRLAQKELYRRYYRYVMSIAMRYTSCYDNAVEMANDAFLKIYMSLKNFEPRYDNTIISFTAWLKKIVIYTCIDHRRKYNKKERMAGVHSDITSLTDESETAEQMLQHKDIIKCIRQLSPAYKQVFNLYVIEGFSHAEIAGKLNVSEGTSKSNLFKAKQNLQKILKESNIINYERTF